MIRYISKRLVLMVAVLMVVNAASFFLINFLDLRGPMAFGYIPDKPVTLAEVVKPYPAYVLALVQDGTAIQRTIISSAGSMLPRSLILLGLSMTLAILAGICIGFLSVNSKKKQTNPIALVASLAGFSMPGFYVGIVAFFIMWQRATRLGPDAFILPVMGYGLDAHLVLPVLALAARPTAEIARLTAEFLVKELPKDYIRTARAKGLPWRLVVIRHAGRNVASAVVTAIGNSLSYLIGALVIIEVAFDWGGVGQGLINSITFNEYAGSNFNPGLVAGLAALLALLFLLSDLLIELSGQVLDPRLRRLVEGRA